MSESAELLEVGRVGRPHGVKGDVFLDLTTDRVERASIGSRLLIAGTWYEIERSQLVPGGDNGRWRVHLAGVERREQAQALTGQVAQAEPIDDPDVMWIHYLVGARVVEVGGTERGNCVAVVANPAADLLELESGALVPVTFVTAVEPGLITIDPPEGLFELFD